MSRTGFELAGAIQKFGRQFTEKYRPNAYHQRILHALSVCRTSALGGHKEACDCCGQIRISYNSCRNRHCPKCQSSKQAAWVEDLLETTLPVKHYHIVFTVPHQLNTICMQDSQWFYGRLFSSVWETLRQFGYTRFGVETGAVCVLHTWGQNLGFHPHIHCLVPAAGETVSGAMKPVGSNGKFLYPVKQLSLVFRAKLMGNIEKELKKKGLSEKYRPLIKAAWSKPWSVHCEPSLGKAEQVIKYLGQYTHRVAITNQRITAINDKTVTFMHKDYADRAKQKPVTLDGVEFLRRFCQHILPHRFVKIRRYGIYSSRARALRNKQNPKMQVSLKPKESPQERLLRLTGFDVYRCPFCKQGTMCRIEELPRVRSPSDFYAQNTAWHL